MPTISEPVWLDLEEKRGRAMMHFYEGTYTYDVLRASLYATGLRGQDLDARVKLAEMEKFNWQPKKPEPTNVLVLNRDKTAVTLRFTDADAAANAVKLLRKQSTVLFASRVRHFNESVEYLPGLLEGSNEHFVASMLALL